MYSFQTLLPEGTNIYGIPDTGGKYAPPDSRNVWLFTSPSAKAAYAQEGRLSDLEQDIRRYVLYNDEWSDTELEFKLELDRLFRDCILVPRPYFGHLSPHPMIYQALAEGNLRVGQASFAFEVGDEIVFEPWPARLYHPGLFGPLRVGRLNTAGHYHLCSEEYPNLAGMDEKALQMLHQISLYHATG